MSFVSTTMWKGWTTQRILNRFPIWSKARTRDDSIAHYLVNPFGQFLDEIFENIINTRRNQFVTTVDLLEQPFAYVLNLPKTFEFAYTEHVAGRLSFTPPTVTATVGLESLDVVVSDIASFQAISKSEVLPTRIDAVRILTNFNDVVIPETAIVSLSSITINDDFLSELGTLYIEIEDGTQFGETLNSGELVVPKVVINGNPWVEEKNREEHLVYRTNGERPTVTRWDSLASIETRGIFDSNATLRAHTGFNKRILREPNAFWEDELGEVLLGYSYENNTYNYNLVPTIQFLSPEVTNVDLQEQGFSTDTLEYEFALMIDEDSYLEEELVGLERIPFTRFFVAATANNLHFFSARIPHLLNWIEEDVNKNNIVSAALKERSLDCELVLAFDRQWLNLSEEDQILSIQTRHQKAVRPIKGTRLSITYSSPALSSVITRYYDWNGNIIIPSNDNNQGYIFNLLSENNNTGWESKKFNLDISSEVQHPAWVAVVKLETKFNDGEVEKDIAILHADYRQIERTIALPESIAGSVNGLTYDARGRLLVSTTAGEVHEIKLYYDYCLIDYKKNMVLFREEYDSVEVVS